MSAELLEYVVTTRLGERGTMTLPKDYRDALQLEAGAPVSLLRLGDGLLLIPEQKRFEQLCQSLTTRLENAGITEAALQATLPQVREELTRSRYPELFSDSGTAKRPKSFAKSNKP
jgi:AbrB family looped-hinge helix DNA binding protein